MYAYLQAILNVLFEYQLTRAHLYQQLLDFLVLLKEINFNTKTSSHNLRHELEKDRYNKTELAITVSLLIRALIVNTYCHITQIPRVRAIYIFYNDLLSHLQRNVLCRYTNYQKSRNLNVLPEAQFSINKFIIKYIDLHFGSRY